MKRRVRCHEVTLEWDDLLEHIASDLARRIAARLPRTIYYPKELVGGVPAEEDWSTRAVEEVID